MKVKHLLSKLTQSKFSRDTLWLIGAQATVLMVGFVLNMGIEKHYGIAELGYFSQSVSFYMICSSLFALGLNNTVIKKIADQRLSQEQKHLIFSQNLFLTLAISSVLSVSVFLMLQFFPTLFSSHELVHLLRIHIIGIPFFSVNKQFAAYYTGERQQHLFAIQRFIRWFGIGVLFFAIVFFNFSLVYVIYAFVLIEILLFVFNVYQNFRSIVFRLDREEIKSSLQFGIKSYIAEIVAVFNSNLDLIILGYLLSSVEIGIYSFLIFFVKALYIFPGIIMQNISPLISTLWQNKQIEELQRKIKSVVKVNLIISLIQFIGMIVFYYSIVHLFKTSMDGSAFYFVIAGFGTFIFSLVSWSGSMLVMSGKLRANFYRTLMILIVSTVNILVFGYYFELVGACIAVCINGILNFLIMRILIKKEMGINVFV